MKEKGFLALIVSLFSMSVASAQIFNLSDMLNSIDSSTIVLGAVFMICFALLFFIFSRVFMRKDRYGMTEPNTNIAMIISLCVSLLIIYGLNKTGLDFSNIFLGLGFSSDTLYILGLLIFIVGAIFLGIKTKWNLLIILGGFFIIVSALGLVYQSTFMFVVGAILILIYFGIRMSKNKKSRGKT
ncbi:MAG: hypothetical protein AABW51_03815 [Nanoarchaeota archaeon]